MPDWKTEAQKLQEWKKDASKVKVKRKKRKKRKDKVEAKEAPPVKKDISRRDVLDCMKAPRYKRVGGSMRQY